MTDLRPSGLNHVAYVTTDTGKTKDFYTQVMKMRLVGYAKEETVGSTGDATSFLHTFFEMGDGTCVAFFEIDGVTIDHHESSLPRWAPHLALSVGSREELEEMHQRVLDAGLEVRGVIEHEGIWSSIYFFDPNGVRLEVTYQNRKLTDDDAAEAETAVAEWLSEHAAPVA